MLADTVSMRERKITQKYFSQAVSVLDLKLVLILCFYCLCSYCTLLWGVAWEGIHKQTNM